MCSTLEKIIINIVNLIGFLLIYSVWIQLMFKKTFKANIKFVAIIKRKYLCHSNHNVNDYYKSYHQHLNYTI